MPEIDAEAVNERFDCGFEQLPVVAMASGKALHVSGLAEGVTPALLTAAFIPFGELVAVEVPVDAEGRCRGFGFVEFAAEEDAVAAIANMDGSELMGRTLKVKVSAGRRSGMKSVWAEAEDWLSKLPGAGATAGTATSS